MCMCAFFEIAEHNPLLHCHGSIGVSFMYSDYLNSFHSEAVSAKKLISWVFLTSKLHVIL